MDVVQISWEPVVWSLWALTISVILCWDLGPPVGIALGKGRRQVSPLPCPTHCGPAGRWRWESREGAGAAQLHYLPSLEQGCTKAAAHPSLPMTIQCWERPDQPPPGLGCAWAPQVLSLSKWRTPIPFGFLHVPEERASDLHSLSRLFYSFMSPQSLW